MPKKLSYDHTINMIKLVYEQSGFDLPRHTLSQEVYNEFSQEIKTTRMAAFYALIDEQIALLRLISLYFASAFSESSIVATIHYTLAIRQMKILTSIRIQCAFGLDMNARLQLRLLYENSVLWTRLRIDSDCLKEFSESKSKEKANVFWHKYLSKSKTEKFLNTDFSDSGHTWLGNYDIQITELKNNLGLAAHPSIFSCLTDSLNDLNSNNYSDKIILNDPCDQSHFTLTQSMFVVSLPFSICPDPEYKIKNIFFLKERELFNYYIHPTESWNDYNVQLQKMIPKLWLISRRCTEEIYNKKLCTATDLI